MFGNSALTAGLPVETSTGGLTRARSVKLGLALATAFALAACAQPQFCEIEQRADLPVRLSGGLPVVDVLINDTPAVLLVDTGSSRTGLTQSGFDRLDVATASTTRAYVDGIGGSFAHAPGIVSDLQLGLLHHRQKMVFVMPDMKIGGMPVDGILGQDILFDYDLDIDWAHRRLGLYRQRTCPDARPDWSFASRKLPRATPDRAVVPNIIPVQINGQAFNGLLDTGASGFFIDHDQAIAVGASDAGLMSGRQSTVTGATGVASAVIVFRFAKADIGGETFTNVTMGVTARPHVIAGRNTGLLIGTPYFLRRRVWISTFTQQLFAAAN